MPVSTAFQQPYFQSFHAELAPAWLGRIANLAGYAAPDPAQPFRYLDIGCGFGQGLSIFALTHPQAQFQGIDILADHINAITERNQAWNLHNLQASQIDLAHFNDDPFDYVVLHGLWSWIDEETRDKVVKLLDRVLAPGGLMLISYNLTPGWSVLEPVLHMLRRDLLLHDFDTAFDRMMALTRDQGGWFSRHPAAKALMHRLANGNPAWRQQEIGGHHRSFWHSDIVQALSPIALSYCGNLEPDSGPGLSPHAEDKRDFDHHRYFRRDVFRRAGETAMPTDIGLLHDIPASHCTRKAPFGPKLEMEDGGLILPAGHLGNGVTLTAIEHAFWRYADLATAANHIEKMEIPILTESGHAATPAEQKDILQIAYKHFQETTLPMLDSFGVASDTVSVKS